MRLHKILTTTGQILIAAAILTANPVIADKPSWAGGGKHDKHQQNERHHDRDERHDNDDNRFDHDSRGRHGFSGDRYFIDRQRTIIRDYYVGEYQATGHCPPGLAKKNNGCMPPGQAKKWVIGRPLPRDVIFYDLPPAVLVNLGAPPPGYRFVRVASDILLITLGTGMVIDAINGFGGY